MSAWATFERLDKLDPNAVGAERDQFEALPFLRFDNDAQGVFSEWHNDLETRLRSGDMPPALESHLAKYRKLVPAIALINHLADGGTALIPVPALARALALSEYLETHATRAYGAGAMSEVATAKAILTRIRKGELQDGFAVRDIRRREWSGLTDTDQIKAGLELLADYDWLAPRTVETGGRPRTEYSVNPEALR
jgi:putative DNA primase/helicase